MDQNKKPEMGQRQMEDMMAKLAAMAQQMQQQVKPMLEEIDRAKAKIKAENPNLREDQVAMLAAAEAGKSGKMPNAGQGGKNAPAANAQAANVGGLDLSGLVEIAKNMQQQGGARGADGPSAGANGFDLSKLMEVAKKMQQQGGAQVQSKAPEPVIKQGRSSVQATSEDYWANACKEAGIPYIRGESQQNTRLRIREARRGQPESGR